MYLRNLLLLGCILSLAVCNLDALASSGDSSAAGGLVTEMVEVKRHGGVGCPSSSEVIPDTGCASVNIHYPKVVKAGSLEAVAALNQLIQRQLKDFNDMEGKQDASLDEMATMFIAEYQRYSINAQNNSPETVSAPSNWKMERQADIVFSNANIVTLKTTNMVYSGGAHEISGKYYSVFDIKTGKQLTLANLLKSGDKSTLNVAAERRFREARSIVPEANLETEGFWFKNNMFSVNDKFGVLANGLSFVFNPYEVAPYSMGETEFTVPYDEIKSILNFSLSMENSDLEYPKNLQSEPVNLESVFVATTFLILLGTLIAMGIWVEKQIRLKQEEMQREHAQRQERARAEQARAEQAREEQEARQHKQRREASRDPSPQDNRTSEQTLSLPAGWTQDDLKTAYRREAQRTHPDKWTGKPPHIQVIMEAEYKAIQQAYKKLRGVVAAS